MKNFEIRMIGRKVEVTFDHPIFAQAIFQAQSTSFACQGQWRLVGVSILKSEYSIEKLKAKVNEGLNVLYY